MIGSIWAKIKFNSEWKMEQIVGEKGENLLKKYFKASSAYSNCDNDFNSLKYVVVCCCGKFLNNLTKGPSMASFKFK